LAGLSLEPPFAITNAYPGVSWFSLRAFSLNRSMRSDCSMSRTCSGFALGSSALPITSKNSESHQFGQPTICDRSTSYSWRIKFVRVRASKVSVPWLSDNLSDITLAPTRCGLGLTLTDATSNEGRETPATGVWPAGKLLAATINNRRDLTIRMRCYRHQIVV